MSIRVAIVEDDTAVRENLQVLISNAPGFSCVAACGSAEEALQKLPIIVPEVVLMDIHLPGKSGIECVARLRTVVPYSHIIMLTIEEDSEQVFDSLKAGATGYLVKHVEPKQILEAIQDVHRGGAPMSSQIARKVVIAFRGVPASTEERLTVREEEVLRLIAKGLRPKDIGESLGLSVTTINTYIRNIYKKLHVRSLAEAVAKSMRSA